MVEAWHGGAMAWWRYGRAEAAGAACRCMISGLTTKNRLMMPSDVTNKRALNFAEQGDHSGAQWGASKRHGLAARLFPAAQ